MKKTSDPPLNVPPQEPEGHDSSAFLGRFSRRSFLTQLGAAGIAATAAPIAHAAGVDASAAVAPDSPEGVPGAVIVMLRVNGRTHRLMLEPRVTLLDAIRDHLKLFGTKKGCDHGQCGACTVHV